MKEKVITVKPFLNNQLTGVKDGKGAFLSPLYYQITYQRKNTQLKSIFNIYLEGLNTISKEDELKLRFEVGMLKKLVRYEGLKYGNEFNMTGLKIKYEIYMRPVDSILEEYLKKRLLKAITMTGSEYQKVLKFDGFESNFLLLLKASKQLIDNLSKHMSADFKEEIDAYKAFVKSSQNKFQRQEIITIMDWIDGDSKIELSRSLNEYFEEDSAGSERTLSILNQIIEDRIKFL